LLSVYSIVNELNAGNLPQENQRSTEKENSMTTQIADKSIQAKNADVEKELAEIEAQIEALEQRKADKLHNATQYVMSGKSYRAILYSHTDVVNGRLARINVLGDKIDQAGAAVVKKARKTQSAPTSKKSRKA
jgi:hypothetical protein